MVGVFDRELDGVSELMSLCLSDPGIIIRPCCRTLVASLSGRPSKNGYLEVMQVEMKGTSLVEEPPRPLICNV